MAETNGGRAEKRSGRVQRSFPASTFDEALAIADAIQKYASGQKVRRLTLFDHIGKSPESGPSRQLVTNSSKYGLTKGGYQAEHLELTEEGRTATSLEAAPADRLRARFKLAIADIAPFNSLYERFKNSKLPTQAIMRDHLLDEGYSAEEVNECVETFVLNAKFLGLLKPIAGAERLLPLEYALEELRTTPNQVVQDGHDGHEGTVSVTPIATSISPEAPLGRPATTATTDWSNVCFYITPIGSAESEQRRHADLFLGSIVEPAIEELGLQVVRADHIGKPGMITAQVIEHVVKSRLVIADLSFHNPNVFYELSLRHACQLPTVQIIRTSDIIPFDLDQFRTIQIDTTDIYSLVPQLQTYRAEITNQARRILEGSDGADNPLTVFYPGLTVTLPQT